MGVHDCVTAVAAAIEVSIPLFEEYQVTSFSGAKPQPGVLMMMKYGDRVVSEDLVSLSG